jgi:large subunit ribosomal protein L11
MIKKMPTIKLLVDAGDMKPGPAVAQQLGPMGINMGKVISDINTATQEFKGIQVPVDLEVDATTKDFSITVRSPAISALIKKELGIEKASGERKKWSVGNLAIEQVISLAKQKHSGMLAKDFLGAVKSVIGSCMAAGVLVESKDPKAILEAIGEGEFKEEIDSQKTEVSPEKKKAIDAYFKKVMSKQEKVKAKEEEEKAVEEAKKAEKATAKPEGEEGETAEAPAEGAEAPAAEAPAEEKK